MAPQAKFGSVLGMGSMLRHNLTWANLVVLYCTEDQPEDCRDVLQSSASLTFLFYSISLCCESAVVDSTDHDVTELERTQVDRHNRIVTDRRWRRPI